MKKENNVEMFLGGLVAGLIVGAVTAYAILVMQAGGKVNRDLGVKVAKKAAADPAFAGRLEQLFVPPPPPKPSAEPVRLLGVLQRESRLLDFLMENIQQFDDQQIGASVRDIHAKAQATLKKHVTLEPVMPNQEGGQVTVQAGFDPSAIRLVGQCNWPAPLQGNTRTCRLAREIDQPAQSARGAG